MSSLAVNSTTRAERRRANTHEQLKTACAELLNEIGYHALTIRAITDRADMGYGTFYLHFADKDDIVWAVVYDISEQWRIHVDSQIAHLPFPYREYQSWIYVFRYVETVREGFVAIFGSKGSAKLLQRYQDYLAQLHEDNLREGIYESGLDLPPAFMGQFITGAIVRLMVWWAETPNDYTPEQLAGMVYQAAYRQPPPE
ncbi:MAG: TetR/AcrR family transcriptional regulator [Anaerolineae bacterium]|nr:TetR/AcrR family transcriptional regulator [Anaerolineae bacterium]